MISDKTKKFSSFSSKTAFFLNQYKNFKYTIYMQENDNNTLYTLHGVLTVHIPKMYTTGITSNLEI